MTWQVPNLYALAAHDMMDFMEIISDSEEVSDEVLEELYTVLTLPNEKHSRHTTELNTLAADLVKPRLEHRGLKIISGKDLKETPLFFWNQ